ncbi:ankyrin repeat-containing domain protein [Aspergillus leporis]|uniref:Ankyrin repeat-containing domain protein n=1 Tax=Aspergillus leporis TaxID=41062 RepID=A0A5N5XF33_9EURO|nr:ankyrin repeat-containing domain protein [Aspergillus leporis]
MKLIEFLLDFGADWRLQDREGNTVLHKAAGRGFEGIVEHILTLPSFTEERAILTRVNKHGNTALHLAAKAPYTTDVATLSTVKSLLDAGFSPNAVNYDGQSLAHLLVRDGLFDDAMKMLSWAELCP